MATLGPVLGDKLYTGSIDLSFLGIHSIISTRFLTVRKFLSLPSLFRRLSQPVQRSWWSHMPHCESQIGESFWWLS